MAQQATFVQGERVRGKISFSDSEAIEWAGAVKTCSPVPNSSEYRVIVSLSAPVFVPSLSIELSEVGVTVDWQGVSTHTNSVSVECQVEA